MIRCSQCGLRLRDAEPSCPQHGRAVKTVDPLLPPTNDDDALQRIEARTPEALRSLGYRVTRVLGRGGFGIVYGAERSTDGLQVALKVVLPEQPLAAAQLDSETAMLQAVGAPWAPRVFEQGTVLARRFVAMEYVAAPTLADRLVEAGAALSLVEFERIAHALMNALGRVHACGIAHRDLKPENIFLCAEGSKLTVKLIDFGLASRDAAALDVKRDVHDEEVTTVEAIGTAEYMSPEQCDGRVDADPRSDIYSLGALFYELLTGAPPFWGKAADVREAQRSRRPAPLQQRIECTPALDQVIRTCLAKDPSRRYADLNALRSALDVALADPSERTGHHMRVEDLRGVSAPTQTAANAREKRSVGLVFFESSSGLAPVQALVTSSGGQIVQTNGAQFIAAFGHDVSDNPVRIAFAAAQRLTMSKLTTRALVDVAQVSVQTRPDGSRRLFSPLFAKKDRFPDASFPEGIVLTGTATEVIPDLRIAALPDKADRFSIVTTEKTHEATTYGIQQATLIGRDEPLARLREHARRALEQSLPSIAVVTSEPGYGKTHFARGLEQQLERIVPTPDIIRITAQESIVGAASQMLPDLLRRLLTLPEQVPEGEARQVLIDRLGPSGEQVWAAAALSLGWIDGTHPEVRKLAAAPGALRLAAARAAGEALRKRARVTPLVVVLDDAHQADDALLDGLEYATMKEANARLWVCALARPQFEQTRGQWGASSAGTTKITLGALDHVHGAELTRRLLHPIDYVAPAVLLRLVERTQGVPRLLVELIRGLKRDGIVRRSERGTGFYLATDELDKLPDLPIVQWNAVREVEALPPQLAGHARLSSVLGNGFSVLELETLMQFLERNQALDDVELDASVGLQRLVDAGMLIRHRNGTMDFRHSLLRDTIYKLVPEAQRARMHRAAFEMYQSISMPAEQRLPRLALHAARSAEKEAAAKLFLELAERSQRAHQYLDAEAAFGNALDNLPENDAERIGIAAGARGLMRFRLGRHEDALRDLRRARECAHALGQQDRELDVMLDEATVLDWMRDFAQSAQLTRQAAELAHQVSPSEIVSAKLASGLTRVYHRSRDTEACVRVGAEAVVKAGALGDVGYEARIVALLMIGCDCVQRQMYDESASYFESAISESTARGDFHHLAAAYINRVHLGFARRDTKQIFEDLARASQLGRELAEPAFEFCAQMSASEVAYSLGELERANEHVQQSYAIARKFYGEHNRELGGCELLMARIELHREAFDQARELLARIRKRIDQAPAPQAAELALLPAEQVMCEMVELCARDASAEEWAAFDERSRGIEMQLMEEVDMLDSRALSAVRAGRRLEARELFERALQLSARSPNLVSARVERNFARTFEVASAV